MVTPSSSLNTFFDISVLLNTGKKNKTQTNKLANLIHTENTNASAGLPIAELAGRINLLNKITSKSLLPKRSLVVRLATFGLLTHCDRQKAKLVLKEKEELTTKYLNLLLQAEPTAKNINLVSGLLDSNYPHMTKEILKYALKHKQGELIKLCRKLPIENTPKEIKQWKELFIAQIKKIDDPKAFEKFETLIAAGIDIHMPIIDNKNALQIVCDLNDGDMVEMLVSVGADVHATKQALIEALERGHTLTAGALIDAGVDLNVDASNDTLYHYDKNKALFIAIDTEQWYVVNRLISKGADLDIISLHTGHTPLTLAIEKNAPEDTIRELLKAGARPNVATDTLPVPLIYAARKGQLGAVKALVENGAKLNLLSTPTFGYTALTTAVKNGHEDMALYLIQAGANINSKLLTLAKSKGLDKVVAEIHHQADLHPPKPVKPKVELETLLSSATPEKPKSRFKLPQVLKKTDPYLRPLETKSRFKLPKLFKKKNATAAPAA